VKVSYGVRSGDPLWPRAMRRRPVMAWLSGGRGVHRRSIESRNHRSGVPTLLDGREGNMGWCEKASAGCAAGDTAAAMIFKVG
jgi:hypothetical protein